MAVGDLQRAGGLLYHALSPSIEEPFYVAWPMPMLILISMGGRRAAIAVALAVVALIAVHRVSVVDGTVPFRTDTRGDSLIVGCTLALLAAEGVTFTTTRSTWRSWLPISVWDLPRSSPPES